MKQIKTNLSVKVELIVGTIIRQVKVHDECAGDILVPILATVQRSRGDIAEDGLVTLLLDRDDSTVTNGIL